MKSFLRPSLLLVVFGALLFALQPALASAQTEFHCVDLSSDCSALVESHSKIDESYNFGHVSPHGSDNFWRSVVTFSSSPFGFAGDVFFKNISSPGGARAESTKPDRRFVGANVPIGEGYSALSNVYLVSQSESEDSQRQAAVLPHRNLSDLFWVDNVSRKPITFYDVRPGIRDSVDLFSNGGVGLNGMLGKRCVNLSSGVPCLGEVKQSLRLVADATSTRNNKLVAKCGDLAVRIIWWSGWVGTSAIGSNDEFAVYELKDDDRTGFDLGMCQITEQENPQKISDNFHLVVKSGGNSLAGFDSGFVCDGCLPIIVREDGTRFAIARVQAIPPQIEPTR